MSSTICTIRDATAETARAGPFDFDRAIDTVRWNGGSTMRAACSRFAATSFHTACNGSTVYSRSDSTSACCRGSESASMAGASVMCRWRAIASSAVRSPFGALGRMKGNSCRLSKRTSAAAVSPVAGRSDQIAVDDGERLLHLGQRRPVAVQDRDVDPRIGEPFLDLTARPLEHLQADRGIAAASVDEQPARPAAVRSTARGRA